MLRLAATMRLPFSGFASISRMALPIPLDAPVITMLLCWITISPPYRYEMFCTVSYACLITVLRLPTLSQSPMKYTFGCPFWVANRVSGV